MKLDFSNIEHLLKQLDEIYPLRNFTKEKSLDSIRYESGQRSVIEFILREWNNQTKKG